jgi:hypothetical protein
MTVEQTSVNEQPSLESESKSESSNESGTWTSFVALARRVLTLPKERVEAIKRTIPNPNLRSEGDDE